jgi:bifunctional non-homologous end joining protein LigD
LKAQIDLGGLAGLLPQAVVRNRAPTNISSVTAIIVCKQACKLGCEGIVSKRLGSPYRSDRSKQWVKVKNRQRRRCGARPRRSG